MARFLSLVVILLAVCGCEEIDTRKPYPLPRPAAESPVCNLPAAFHQRNKLGRLGQGSCVHASLVNHLRWLNQFELAQRWWAQYGDGETASGIRRKLDAAGLGSKYYFTEKADPRFLDWCTINRVGAILWWKPSHCCTFMGFSNGADILAYNPQATADGQRLEPSRQYACILDNNYPGRFEYTERAQFVRLWAGYGGFALAVLDNPTPSIPFPLYELR